MILIQYCIFFCENYFWNKLIFAVMCFGHAYEHTRGECMCVQQKKDKNSVITDQRSVTFHLFLWSKFSKIQIDLWFGLNEVFQIEESFKMD